MTASPIGGKQMKRLQTLWGLFCRNASLQPGGVGLDPKDREARLGWVAGAIGRQIKSFGELTADEASTAIDAIQKHLPPELLKRKRPSRRLAHAYGTAGRRGREEKEVRLVDAETWRLLAERHLASAGIFRLGCRSAEARRVNRSWISAATHTAEEKAKQ